MLRQTLLLVCSCAGLLAQQPEHWSYRPIVRPAVPSPTDAADASPIDRFVARRMAAHGLSPAGQADPATWLRRVTLDLTGLPPTVAELDAFVADRADGVDGARERVVDRLLASAAFAERWAQWWLDLARYADSQGYEKDGLRRSMWRYRDWVIDAFRRGLPFDRFTIEQLAGDLLPDAGPEQVLATAFHRQTMTNTEGGTDDEEFRVAAVVDRVDTTLSVWMGTTIGCAQCHDHKYDPFSQREFFEVFAYFDQTEDADRGNDAPTMRFPTLADRAATKAIELELSDLRRQLDDARHAAQAAAPGAAMGGWHLLGPLAGSSFDDAHARAFAPEVDGVQLDRQQEGLDWQARDFADGEVHTWRGDNSAFYLHRVITATEPGRATLALGSDDAIKVFWNGEQQLDHKIGRGAAPAQELLVVDLQQGDNELLLKITNGGGPGGFCFDLWSARVGELRARITELERRLDEHLGPAVPILRELPADRARHTRVHIRGSFLDQGDPVQMATPSIWPPMSPELPNDRLGFAQWLMADDNPLTARVLANRIWSELFGKGIVTTLEDFGTQGEPPSHPQLLDWLAREFLDSGWSFRGLLKTIVLSQTYGRSSRWTAEHHERDPDNVWLSRGPSFRLSAEQLRDQALAVSGLLHDEVGGPSVMPPQPGGVWRQMYSNEKWRSADGPQRYRRALYTFWRRTSPHPMMLVFDAQSREACVLRRQRTNTPLQALVLWNDPQFVEPAVRLGERARAAADDDAARVRWLWRTCLLREPDRPEVERLLQLLSDERAAGLADDDAFAALAGVTIGLDEFLTRR